MSTATGRVTASKRRSWWLALLLPLGLTTWAAFLYLGYRTRRRVFYALSVFYAATLAVWLVLDSGDAHGAQEAIAAVFALVTFVGGLVHGIVIRPKVATELDLADSASVKQASRELERRAYGRELLARNPALARQVGVGRPDLPGADSYGLVDVNHADGRALAQLPGIAQEQAERVAAFCAEGGSFVSVEDLGLFLDLPPASVEGLRDKAVFVRDP